MCNGRPRAVMRRSTVRWRNWTRCEADHRGPSPWCSATRCGSYTAGVADLSTGRLIGLNNRMRVASTSKAVSGAVALSLVSKGALSLNDTIGELLAKQPKKWREKLLSHIRAKKLRFNPGSRYKYSNSDNIVVALMVKSAKNRTYNGRLQE